MLIVWAFIGWLFFAKTFDFFVTGEFCWNCPDMMGYVVPVYVHVSIFSRKVKKIHAYFSTNQKSVKVLTM